MNVLICGAGKTGTSLIRYLQNDCDVTVIDKDDKNLSNLSAEFEIKTVCGKISDIETLKKAGIETTDVMISALQDDDLNLFVCHLGASLFNVQKRIARITNQQDSITKAFSVNEVISPELEVANHIANKVEDFCILEKHRAFNGELSMLLVSFSNPDINEIKNAFNDLNVLLVAVLRGKKFLDHTKLEELASKDRLLIVIQTRYITELIKSFQDENSNKKILIIGGGNVGFFLAKKLEEFQNSSEIILIEEDKDRAQFLAEQLSKAKVMNGSGVDVNLLQEIDIDQNSIVISVTNDDQVNIFSQLLLKNSNAASDITLLQDPAYIKIGESIGVKNIVLPNQITLESFSKLFTNIDSGSNNLPRHHMCNNLFVFIELELKDAEALKKLSKLNYSLVRSVILFRNKKLLPLNKDSNDIQIYDKILICTSKVDEIIQHFS